MQQRKDIPATLQTDIVQRFLNGKDFVSFLDSYKAARIRGWAGEPTEIQQAIAKDRKNGGNYKDIAKKYRVTEASAYSAVRRVAIWQFMN